jgi:hypothetical protein
MSTIVFFQNPGSNLCSKLAEWEEEVKSKDFWTLKPPCLNGHWSWEASTEVKSGWKGPGLGKYLGKSCECQDGVMKCGSP